MTAAFDLDSIYLDRGAHDSRKEGLCVMEAVAWFAGRSHSDAPPCVSPMLRNFGMSLNDRWPDERRQLLKPFIPLLPGTAGDGQDEARSYLALDWLIRTFTPAWLDLAGLTEAAAELRSLRRIADMTAAEAAGSGVRQARTQAVALGAAAWDVAGDAARAAARDAARNAAKDAAWDAAAHAAKAAAGAQEVAAWDAARAAAWAAARAAARDTAWAAARAAMRDAARTALQPTVEQIQDSALDLYRRMINPAAVTDA